MQHLSLIVPHLVFISNFLEVLHIPFMSETILHLLQTHETALAGLYVTQAEHFHLRFVRVEGNSP